MTARHCIALFVGAAVWTGAFTAECEQSSAACPKGLDCSHPGPPCLEDEPCFRWSTMGNHQRGVTILQRNGGSHFAIVGSCRYRHLWQAGKVPYSVRVDGARVPLNPRVPGDGWARQKGCER